MTIQELIDELSYMQNAVSADVQVALLGKNSVGKETLKPVESIAVEVSSDKQKYIILLP